MFVLEASVWIKLHTNASQCLWRGQLFHVVLQIASYFSRGLTTGFPLCKNTRSLSWPTANYFLVKHKANWSVIRWELTLVAWTRCWLVRFHQSNRCKAFVSLEESTKPRDPRMLWRHRNRRCQKMNFTRSVWKREGKRISKEWKKKMKGDFVSTVLEKSAKWFITELVLFMSVALKCVLLLQQDRLSKRWTFLLTILCCRIQAKAKELRNRQAEEQKRWERRCFSKSTVVMLLIITADVSFCGGSGQARNQGGAIPPWKNVLDIV